ncbi:hypothetical protein EPO14_01765 [Patescibacteria group bacterium]|nr:MAG: hypothetical protein EPO14_01765 [Patescibacteria group bacterium]
MRRVLISASAVILIALFSSPLYAVAETASAGIPAGNIWLSKNAVIEKESVRIFLPVYNASATKISGDAIFSVDTIQVGTAHFELDAGNSTIVSSTWTTTKGAHSITARLEGTVDAKTGTEISVSANTQTLAVDIAERPPAPALVQALGIVASVAQNTVSVALPVVASVANTVFKETEQLRESAVVALENSLNGTTASSDATPSQGLVLGAETFRAPANNDGLMATAITAPTSEGVMRILQTILLFLVSYQWIFYPLLLLILLGLLFLIGKGMSRKQTPKRG